MINWRKELTVGLPLAALMLGTVTVLAFSRQLGLGIDPGLGVRVFGILCGVMLAIFGNAIPKRMVRYEPGSDGPARRQACLRFCGWVFALAGLANAAIWALAPLKTAAFWSMFPLAGALLLVGARIMLPKTRRA